MLYFYVLLIGLLVGFISIIFGIGGGVIAVSALYQLFPDLPPQIIIACSLGMICLNSLTNVYFFIRSGKRPHLRIIIPIGLSVSAGVLVGGFITELLSQVMVKKLFGVLLVLIVAKLLFQKSGHGEETEWEEKLRQPLLFKCLLTGFSGGLLSGLTGLGGGAIMVPLFITLLSMPFKWISLYSNSAMFFGTGTGVIYYLLKKTPALSHFDAFPIFKNFQFGAVNFLIIALIVLGSNISSRLAIKIHHRMDPVLIKWLYVALLIFIAIKILAFS